MWSVDERGKKKRWLKKILKKRGENKRKGGIDVCVLKKKRK